VASLTVENYAKTIYQICVAQQGKAAATGVIAASLDVSPGTVTSMLKTLSDSGLATYTPYEGAVLSEAGRLLALRILRRHRLIELFLATTLDLTWDEVHDEAENMEHAVSDFLVDRMDAFLNHPTTDPHGDPIPSAAGVVPPVPGQTLATVEIGANFSLLRVLDQSPDFLRHLSDGGIAITTTGKVTENNEVTGVLRIEIEGKETTLSREAARKMLVAVETM